MLPHRWELTSRQLCRETVQEESKNRFRKHFFFWKIKEFIDRTEGLESKAVYPSPGNFLEIYFPMAITYPHNPRTSYMHLYFE